MSNPGSSSAEQRKRKQKTETSKVRCFLKIKPKHFFLQVSTQIRLFPSMLIYNANNVCSLIFKTSKKFQAPLEVLIFTSPILQRHRKDTAGFGKKVHRAEQWQQEVQTGNPQSHIQPFLSHYLFLKLLR